MGEFDLIQRFFQRPSRRAVLGVGDDCALIQPTSGQQLAISTDMLVEGRHFLSTVDPARLGRKALAVNLSDLAACGAQPLAFTLALALPRADHHWLEGFSRGLLALADAQGGELIGGDTISTSVAPWGMPGWLSRFFAVIIRRLAKCSSVRVPAWSAPRPGLNWGSRCEGWRMRQST